MRMNQIYTPFGGNDSSVSQGFDTILEHYHVVYTLHGPTPLDDSSFIDSIRPSDLPPATSLSDSRLSPYAFFLAQHVLVVPVTGVQHMPPVRYTESPQRVQLPCLIHYYIDVPGSTQLADPLCCRLWCAMRYGDEMDSSMSVCEATKLEEQLLCDYTSPLVQPPQTRSIRSKGG